MIKILDNVLSKGECEYLIETYTKDLHKMSTLGINVDTYRTADGTWIYNNDELSLKIQRQLIF